MCVAEFTGTTDPDGEGGAGRRASTGSPGTFVESLGMQHPGETAFDRLSRAVGSPPDPPVAEVRGAQLRLSLQMADAGIRMMRLSLRRDHPDESDAAIEARLTAWLHHRPGAEDGDAWGRSAPERFSSR